MVSYILPDHNKISLHLPILFSGETSTGFILKKNRGSETHPPLYKQNLFCYRRLSKRPGNNLNAVFPVYPAAVILPGTEAGHAICSTLDTISYLYQPFT